MLRTTPTTESERPHTRVMVVDDSAVVRGFIVRILESDPSIEVLATCSNGQTAVNQAARIRPDIVILDIEMPVMDGLTALPKILAADPGTRIIMASTLTQKNAEISLEALARGATDYIPKPSASQLNGSDNFKRDLLGKIAALGRRAGVSAQPDIFAKASAKPVEPAFGLRNATLRDPGILAIGRARIEPWYRSHRRRRCLDHPRRT